MSGAAKEENLHTLVRMANQIAIAFRAQTHDSAIAATAEHIQLYWTKKMRADIFAHLDAGGAGLAPMTREAIIALRAATP